MKPVCVPCQRFFRLKKIGFYFIEGMPIEQGALPGNIEPEKWGPYKLWVGDRFECEGCGTVILSGFGKGPICERHKPNFLDTAKRLGATFQVNDC